MRMCIILALFLTSCTHPVNKPKFDYGLICKNGTTSITVDINGTEEQVCIITKSDCYLLFKYIDELEKK